MNLIKVFERFPDQQACFDYLEAVRWHGKPQCPLCNSHDVAKKKDKNRIGRWNCHACKSSFNVLSGTIFQKTKIPLQKWFLAIALILNAKKSLSSWQLSRDLEMTQPSAWYLQVRVRLAMGQMRSKKLLRGIVEADETFIGGRPRKPNKHFENRPPRDKYSDKTPVIGAVERGGQVRAQVKHPPGTPLRTNIRHLMATWLHKKRTRLMTDEAREFHNIDAIGVEHEVVRHAVRYALGDVHTNTIEGFWSLLKRAWYGSHHHYSKEDMQLYLSEATWKYNYRNNPNPFSAFITGCFND